MGHWLEFVEGTPEQQRLALLEQLFDPTTVRHLDRIGVAPGWKCLEVGAGAGSIARVLANRAGGENVVATDINIDPLEPLTKEHGVTVLRHNVAVDDAPGSFDLIHARYVLEHLSARDDIVERLVSWLKPGGWLLLESASPVAELTTRPAIRRVIETGVAMWVKMLGTDITWARGYPLPLIAAGLQECGAEGSAPPILGGSPMAAWVQATLELGAEPAISAGLITRDEIDEAYAHFADPSYVEYLWFSVAAWGQSVR
jgi:SAM-dependent methyltransferase